MCVLCTYSVLCNKTNKNFHVLDVVKKKIYTIYGLFSVYYTKLYTTNLYFYYPRKASFYLLLNTKQTISFLRAVFRSIMDFYTFFLRYTVTFLKNIYLKLKFIVEFWSLGTCIYLYVVPACYNTSNLHYSGFGLWTSKVVKNVLLLNYIYLIY